MIQLDSFNNNNNSNNMQWFNAIAIGVLGIWSFSKLLKAKVQHLHRNPLEHPIIIHHPHYKATIAFTDIYTAFQNFIVWHMIISIILLSCNLQHYCIPSSSGVLFHDTTVSYHVLSMLYNPLYLVVPCRTRFIWTCSVGVSVGSVGVFVDFFLAQVMMSPDQADQVAQKSECSEVTEVTWRHNQDRTPRTTRQTGHNATREQRCTTFNDSFGLVLQRCVLSSSTHGTVLVFMIHFGRSLIVHETFTSLLLLEWHRESPQDTAKDVRDWILDVFLRSLSFLKKPRGPCRSDFKIMAKSASI